MTDNLETFEQPGVINLESFTDRQRTIIVGWINQELQSAILNGITIAQPPLPENVAYLDVSQSFTESQYINRQSAAVSGDYVDAFGVQVGVNGLSGASSVAFYGANVGVIVSETTHNLTGSVAGATSFFNLQTGVTIASAAGHIINALLDGTGTLTSSAGLIINQQASAAGTYANHHGITIADFFNPGGATMTKFAGIAVPDLTATNASNIVLGASDAPAGTFSIYNESARDNYFVGSLQLGGYSATRTAKLYVSKIATTTGATAYYNIWSDYSLQPASNSGAFLSGIGSFVDVPSSVSANFTGGANSIVSVISFTGSGTISSLQSGRFEASLRGAGTATLAVGVAGFVTNSGGGNVTKGIAFLVDTFTNSGGGTFTNAAGFAMADLAVGTNKTNVLLGTTTVPSGTYNIYAASTLANYFAGAVTIQNGFTVQQSATFFPSFVAAESTFETGPQVLIRKARGSLGSETIVTDGTVIGGFLFQGYDGAAYQTAAFISATVHGTPGAGDMPGALRFWTTPDGSTTAAERLTITQQGNIGFNISVLGTSAAKAIGIGNGTAPSAAITGTQVWSSTDGLNLAYTIAKAWVIGDKFGAFGKAAVAQVATYTQTYSTASRTVPNATASNPPAGGTGATAGAYDTAANRNAMITSLTNCIADVAALKQVVNSLIDDLQAYGLVP